MKLKSFHIIVAAILLPVLLQSMPVNGQDAYKNLPELSLPISNQKLVIAHCMTNIIRYKGREFEDGCNPKYYPVDNNSTASIGGMTQVNLLQDEWLKNATLEEAVAFELHAAKRAGIDGFQFYYTLNDNGSDSIIRAYLKVATEQQIDFKFTFCISHPSGLNEAQKINALAQRINGILDAAGRDNPHWLRTPDGRLLVYLWYGEQLADVPGGNVLPPAYYAAHAYANLAAAVKEKFACVYSINADIGRDELNQWLDYFPAVWLWTLPYKKNYAGYFIAAACKQRKRNFTGSAFPDFYTSKILKPGTWQILDAKAAVAADLKGIERKAIVTGLSYNFRKLLEFSIAQDISIINIITWNDYPEGHHLAPEANHNDGFSILLKYYKSRWRNDTSAIQKDMAVVFYKKYAHDVQPAPFNIPVIYIEKGAAKPVGEDGIEVVTFLTAAGMLNMNGQQAAVPAGMHVTKFAQQPGPVTITVRVDGKATIRFTSPEPITAAPLRTDRLTYSYSSETAAYYKTMLEDYPATTLSPTDKAAYQ